MEGMKARVIRVLATGSFGSVLLVALPGQGAGVVALKVLPIEGDRYNDPEYDSLRALRLRGDVPYTIRALGAIVVRTLPDMLKRHVVVDHTQHHLIIAMPYVKGHTLRAYLAASTLLHVQMTLPEIVRFSLQITAFCQRAYDRLRLTHNDLKLGNIMVDSEANTLRVIDFTFATRDGAVSDGDEGITWRRGTLAFMPPEKLFFERRPSWIDPRAKATGDIWSIGVIMSTMALCATPFFDDDELFDNCRFNPSFTDTLFQLLPASTPWFANVVSRMLAECVVQRPWLEQGVRLLLWTRVISKNDDFALPGNEYMPGIQQTPLHKILDKYTDEILALYDAKGGRVFELVFDALYKKLGPDAWAVYVSTQVWHPGNRRSGNSPFGWLVEKLTHLVGLTGREIYTENAPVMLAEGSAPFFTGGSLETMLAQIATSPCLQCRAPMPFDTKDDYCSVACKAWAERTD
jgi:serine/threonine protein kinase